jgi:hypothetical protein
VPLMLAPLVSWDVPLGTETFLPIIALPINNRSEV